MEYFVITSLFVFGLIVGSFLNVVIFRWNTGQSVSHGRSKCFSCDKTLVWYELIPLLSFLIQRGRCRSCGTRFSKQYFMVELAAALALPAVFVFYEASLSMQFLAYIVLCLYIVIFVYDLRHKIIPDFFSYAAAFIGLLMIFLDWQVAGSFDFYRLLAGCILALFFFFFWFVSRGRWMGLGDAKLALSVGFVLGLGQGIAAILLAFWIGAVFALILMAIERLRGRTGLGFKSEIPFGPFILIGFSVSFFFQMDIQSILYYLAV